MVRDPSLFLEGCANEELLLFLVQSPTASAACPRSSNEMEKTFTKMYAKYWNFCAVCAIEKIIQETIARQGAVQIAKPPELWNIYERLKSWEDTVSFFFLKENEKVPFVPYSIKLSSYLSSSTSIFNAKSRIMRYWNALLWEVKTFPVQCFN